MSGKKRKVVFAIVEGPSDDMALGVLITRFYKDSNVYVHIVHGDITSDVESNQSNIVSRVGDMVKGYAKGQKLKLSDFSHIIHISDTDGAFVPDEAVVDDASALNPHYTETVIITRDKSKIELRNRRKSLNLKRLAACPQICKIPYRIYYMSCNLDHALYGKCNCTDEEKEIAALAFARKYKTDIPAFVEFLLGSNFSVTVNYSESWTYIQEGLHSLERHTNLGLCFQAAQTNPAIEGL